MAKAGKSNIERDPTAVQGHLIGGGIGSLAAATYMIRDAGMEGANIHIYECLDVYGGSMDGSGDAEKGYMIRGGRMFNLPAYECTQDVFSEIPSLEYDDMSVTEELIEFNEEFKTMSRARLVNADGTKVDVTKMGMDGGDRLKMAKLLMESEESLKNAKICEYFGEHFFTTNFWYMWQTTFAFQPWSSVAEFRRYIIRFMHEFPRIHTLHGVARTQYNQYDSLIVPMVTWLKSKGVNFHKDVLVTDIKFTDLDEGRFVTDIFMQEEDGGEKRVDVKATDIVTFTNGCMTDNATEGDMDSVVEVNRSGDAPSFTLWKKIAEGRHELGRPDIFCTDIDASLWESFTVTIRNNPALFNHIQRFTHNHAGGGALVTFKESSWLLSIVVAHQPHFKSQPLDTQIFWGYSLYPDKAGDYVKKPMLECTGREVMEELFGHLHASERSDEFMKGLTCRTCVMPYITSQFMPRNVEDRPEIVPKGYENFAFVSQFAEQPDDVVFTVEYSVRAAQRAVYHLLGVDRELTPISKHEHEPKVLMDSFLKLNS